jgi:predicted membrane protein
VCIVTIVQAIDYDRDASYQKQMRSNAMKQTAYCVISLIIFIIAIVSNDPNIAAAVPGDGLTLMFVDIGIVVAVILLCRWQYS